MIAAMSLPAQRFVYPRVPVTICVLTYGDYAALARQTIDSILSHCDRREYLLFVGANAVGDETRAYLEALHADGAIDRLFISDTNINKCPMMRRMFEAVDTPFVWWFDDDSFVENRRALPDRLRVAHEARPEEVLWGHVFFFGNEADFNYGTDVVGFVKTAPWYTGKQPPSWEPGGKGEHDFEGKGTGDGRWFFVTGGNWFMRLSAIRALDWPDPHLIKRNDDVLLCEAIRQQGWTFRDIGPCGVAINTAPRRGVGEDPATMAQQMGRTTNTLATLDLGGWFEDNEAAVYQRLTRAVPRGGTVVEIGVWKGRSISRVLDICRERALTIYAIDQWRYAPDDPHFGEARTVDIFDVFQANLAQLGHTDTVRIIREDSADAARHFADASIDLLFLDGDHSHEGVKRDLLAWIPKMKPDGVLFGHDYTWFEGVRTAVAEVLGNRFELVGGSLWQMLPVLSTPVSEARGAIFIPTFRDGRLLEENWSGRPELARLPDIHVFDDNFEEAESALVRELCERNGWHYHASGRSTHGHWMEEYGDTSGFNRFMFDSILALGDDYDFVIKMDTDAYVVDPDFHLEFARQLHGRSAIAGTIETRATRDVMSFWEIARAAGYSYPVGDHVGHIQGGISGFSKRALQRLREMGFLEGPHAGYGEDGYISYACMLLGIELRETQQTMSWWRHYRPPVDQLRSLKAIHPMTRREWQGAS